VLLGASSSGGASGCDKTIWIMSVSFLGGVALLSVVVVLLVVKFERVGKVVYGYRSRAKSLKDLEKYLDKRKTMGATTTAQTSQQPLAEP